MPSRLWPRLASANANCFLGTSNRDRKAGLVVPVEAALRKVLPEQVAHQQAAHHLKAHLRAEEVAR